MTGVNLSQNGVQFESPDVLGMLKRLLGVLPTIEIVGGESEVGTDVNSINDFLMQLREKLKSIHPEELLRRLLSVIPETATEESYQEAIGKLWKIYKELLPEETSMMEKFRESSTLEVKKQVWEEIYKPMTLNLADSFAGEGAKLWNEAFENELSDAEIDIVDLINSWLFLLTKVFAISSRLDDMEKSVELSMFGFVLYFRGVKILNEKSVEEARKTLKQDFELIIKKILESGYEFQKADDHLLFEVLEDI